MASERKTLIKLEGEYDIWRQQELQAALATIDGSARVDLSRVTYGDSSFLQEFVRLKKRLDGATVTLAGANQNVRRLLTIAGFDKIFEIVD